MSIYRIITPATPRRPGKPYADFEAGQTVSGPFDAVTRVIDLHGRQGCAVWKRKAGHWELILDTTVMERASC